MTTLTCEHCDSEIDVKKDPKCVVYDPSGATDVKCERCRELAWKQWRERTLAEWSASEVAQLHEAYRIKRGWHE